MRIILMDSPANADSLCRRMPGTPLHVQRQQDTLTAFVGTGQSSGKGCRSHKLNHFLLIKAAPAGWLA